jgi:hypothetical protein
VARNSYGQVSNNLTVRVTAPTATPVPTPFVRKFLANPSIIIAGTPVLVEWDVEGADMVSIQPIGSNLPPVQTISQSPQQNTTYVLNAANGSSAIQPIAVQVFVTPPPTSTPEPNAPEIVFFNADPAELIQGQADPSEDEKDVTLSWLVRGTVTNVELNGGPDIGIFSNLSPEGSLPVSVDRNTVFVLTAFNQDKTSSMTTQVEILEATPTATTPPPSATPLPLAVIREFRISDPGEPQVRFIDDSGDTRRYEVQNNTNSVFRWEVDGATKITLTEPGSSQDVGAVGQSTKRISDSGIKTFTLIAENGEGKRVQRVIEVQVVTQPPPNPPFNVIGTERPADKENELRWQWDFTPSRNDIIGFRLYRADVPGSDFSQIANEGDLDRDTRDFVDDSVNETCGKAYYVVAVYLDLEGVPQESPVSTNSWYSTPCP